MTATIYAVSAVITAVFATRAWLLDRVDPARKALMWLGWVLGVGYITFALAFLPRLDWLRGVWTVLGGVAPAYAYACAAHLFPRPGGPGTLARVLPRVAWPLCLGMSALHALAYDDRIHTSPPELAIGVFALTVLLLTLRHLSRARASANLIVERTRIGWLMSLVWLATLATVAEWFARYVRPPIDESQLAFLDRGLVLQGPIPPLSCLLVASGVYLLYHALAARRLVALQELVTRMLVIGSAAVLLLAVHALTTRWVALSRFPLHGSFLLTLVSSLFLSLYGAAREPVQRAVGRWFNTYGQALQDAVDSLEREIGACLTSASLADALAARLHGSGRFQNVSVYLFDRPLAAYRRRAAMGPTVLRPLEAVAPSPFADGLQAGVPLYDRRNPRSDLDPTSLALLDAMDADTVLPMRFGGVVLGWVALRDEVWSDGFSVEEIERVERVTRRAALALRNIESFRRLEEERRLAALGTLSAGLAHEIRNPLAGLKGAAQVLQDVGLPDEGADMAEVILLETNRLDQVVTQFLDYARPFSLEDHLSAVDVRDVVRRVTPLVQASGLPDGVSLALDLGEVPAVRGDASRLTQVLLNLVQNALHAVGDAGTVTLRTRPSQLASRPAVDLSVHDDGRGVAPEHRAQLFTPFFTTRPEGTGLGLPICRRIVEAHGGELEVRHDVPGTTFIVRLPASGPSGDQ